MKFHGHSMERYEKSSVRSDQMSPTLNVGGEDLG